MVRSKEDAFALIKTNGIKLSNHKSVIVTGNNSIYLDTENIDPSDSSERFVLKGKEEIKDTKEDKKQTSKKIKDGTSENNI